MNRQELIQQIRSRQSYLCIGLDTDSTKIPSHLLNEPDPVFAFNRAIIDATRDLCVSYKINTAFYEAMGMGGWASMEKTIQYIGKAHFTIADAKRGDIGNTSAQYAKAFFETLPFDAVTIAPYMGEDSVRPFLQHPGKWTIVLGLTSNAGATDFELLPMADRKSHAGNVRLLYEQVMHTVSAWGNTGNLMFVVGATRADQFVAIRKQLPEHFFLVPGVGAQGGSLQEISQQAMNSDVGILVNISRAVIYASAQKDFADAARVVAARYQQEMQLYLAEIFKRQL